MADTKAGSDMLAGIAAVTLVVLFIGAGLGVVQWVGQSSVPPAAASEHKIVKPEHKTFDEAAPDKGAGDVTPPVVPKPETGAPDKDAGKDAGAAKDAGAEVKPPAPPPAP